MCDIKIAYIHKWMCWRGSLKMMQLSELRSIICNYIIIKEWIENGEFIETNKIVVVGTRFQAVMVKFLFRKCSKRIFYCTKLEKEYLYNNKTKWIIFNIALRKVLPENDHNILFMPIN